MACPPKGFALRASNPGLWIPEGDWHQYEAYIFGSLQRRFPEARVLPNAHLPGIKCGKMRQIDVLVERSLGEFDLKIAFDCKCYKRKVNVNDVERFLGMLDDIRVSKGVLVTTKGYSKTAYARAQREPRDVDLQILTPDRLSQYQYVGCAWLWRGPVMAIVEPPNWMARRQSGHRQVWRVPVFHVPSRAHSRIGEKVVPLSLRQYSTQDPRDADDGSDSGNARESHNRKDSNGEV